MQGEFRVGQSRFEFGLLRLCKNIGVYIFLFFYDEQADTKNMSKNESFFFFFANSVNDFAWNAVRTDNSFQEERYIGDLAS